MKTNQALSCFVSHRSAHRSHNVPGNSLRQPRSPLLFCVVFLLLGALHASGATPPTEQLCETASVSGGNYRCTNGYFGAPGTTIQVLGYSFGDSTVVDVYFDDSEIGPAVTNPEGIFLLPIQVPATAAIGQHWITAVQLSNDAAAQQQFQVEDNWSAFRYSAVHKADNYYENILGLNDVGNIDVAWSYLTGGMVFSSPAQLDTVTYSKGVTTAHFDTYFASFDSSIYDVDGVAGTEKWHYATNGFVTTSPVVSNGSVFVGSSDDYLYALNASTGVLEWSFPTYGSVFSSPAVAGGNIYFGSNDFNIYALNAGNGAYVWNFTATNTVGASPAVSNGTVYIADDNANVYALNAASGAQIWSDNLTYSCSTGTIRQARPPQYVGSLTVTSPAVSDGVVFIGYNNGIYALHGETGATIWSSQLSDQSCGVPSSPAVANGILYAGSQDNNVYALNARTGTILWNYTTGGPVGSSPAVANGVVYVGSDDGNLYALNAATGALLWNFPTGSSIVSSPTISNGTLYVGSDDGNLYAFNLAGGTQLRTGTGRPDPAKLRPNLK
jgi:outer membrane protein assembly factor BamB